ncbi:hypothetical protein D3C74_314980 [compost metagenome]
MLDEPDHILLRLRRELALPGCFRFGAGRFAVLQIPQLIVGIRRSGASGRSLLALLHLGFEQVGLAQLAGLDQTGVDMLLNRQHGIDEALHGIYTIRH